MEWTRSMLVLLPLALVAAAPPVRSESDEQILFELVNLERKKEKLPTLRLNPLLTRAARLHVENMARQEKMNHILDGKGVGDRVTAMGYEFRIVGENLAMSAIEGTRDAPPESPYEIHENWMGSPGHRANILHPKYREIGLHRCHSKKGTFFYVQVFAAHLD